MNSRYLFALPLLFQRGGLVLNSSQETWYQSLQKPSWTPPALAFPIAWTILYALMRVSAWMIWKKRAEYPFASTALAFFLIQLVLNTAWSWIFFGRHQIGWALVEISTLCLAISATLYFFWRVSPAAGMLLAPYLAWVSFAVVLNWVIWTKN